MRLRPALLVLLFVLAPALEAAAGERRGVGKASFSEGDIAENICSLVDAVNKAKPSGAKGTYIKKISVSSTMGPGIKLDIGPLLERAGEG